MQLKKIKLSGFKSFVDPTTVLFPSRLCAVVGPNGCGKSNIIDALRWVMGESSAKLLRGQEMADVIFNGSSNRKAAGQASVELIFDNSDHSLLGTYANYEEISVRRVVTRQGQSNYYLNGTKCRRRDVSDVFLGTGLGPRSYSIIEQGMISRFIEAKPEELRAYIEEAAGISKYKERRRETENRIRHTRDNLARLTDLRDELEKQLQHLNRQARTAERYKELKAVERGFEDQLMALRWQRYDNDCQQLQIRSQVSQVAIESVLTERAGLLNILASERQKFNEVSDKYHEIEQQNYQCGTELARIESQIQYQKQRHAEHLQEKNQIQQNLQNLQRDLQQDQERHAILTNTIADVEPELTILQEQIAEQTEQRDELETLFHATQEQILHLHQEKNAQHHQAEWSQKDIQQTEQYIIQAEQKQAQQLDEFNHIEIKTLTIEVEKFQQAYQAKQQEKEHFAGCLTQIQEEFTNLKTQNKILREQQTDAQKHIQQLERQYTTLDALQQTALGKENKTVVTWLARHQLADAPRLGQMLEIEKGWERALEAVLGYHLQAIGLESFAEIAAHLSEFTQGQFSAFLISEKSVTRSDSSAINTLNLTLNLPLLQKFVKSSWNIYHFLAGVYTCDSVEEAFTLREKLSPGTSLITREGIWLGDNWLRLSRNTEEHQGMLQRAQEIKVVQEQLAQAQSHIENLEAELQTNEAAFLHIQSEREIVQENYQQCYENLHQQESQYRIEKERLQQVSKRQQQLEEYLQESAQNLSELREQLLTKRETWQQQVQLIADSQDEFLELENKRLNLQAELQTMREHLRSVQQTVHQQELILSNAKTELTSVLQRIERATPQAQQFKQRLEALQILLSQPESSAEDLTAMQQKLLQQKFMLETQMQGCRQQRQDAQQILQDQERFLQDLNQAIDEKRQAYQANQLDLQTALTKRLSLEEQASELNVVIATQLETLPKNADQEVWLLELRQVQSRLERLGPINLAAIAEYETQSERKNYLDQQNEDLVSALTTLEQAIGKIDKETRMRFKETFDKINENFETLFPKVFGGGKGTLELTGDDLLDTGILVMARPPGKKNSTIHLLSGGEKAMTAVALVFAIFQINPAPFCLLDEVDAPLDDANVLRYTQLVTEMSQRVQFIFISHNKLAIEMAQHLLGVTMHEPGVSRLVSVDLQEAVSLAAI